jgi:molybdopterin molybdotransferase
LAATCGYSHLRVTRPPSIAVLGTGDEAVPIEATPAAHQIRRSNAVALQTGLHNAGLRNCRSFHLPDAMDALIEGLEARIASDDILIITGGISMGKRDLIPEALDRLNFRCHFHGVQQKPGKPFAFYSRGDKAVFGLPGNPLSAICCLHHYVIPAVYAAMGASRPPEPRHGRLTAAAPGRTGMTRFLPVALEADDRCHPHPPSNSGDLVTVLKTDGYLLVPEGEEAVAGARFAYFPWH